MKRGRPSAQNPQSKKQKTDRDDSQKSAAQSENDVPSPQRRSLTKLPPLTEEQIKARFEGMTTRHKRTPVKKLLEGSEVEDRKKASPKAPRTPSTPKGSAPKSQNPEQSTDSAVKRGRGRPPKQQGEAQVVTKSTPPVTKVTSSTPQSAVIKQRELIPQAIVPNKSRTGTTVEAVGNRSTVPAEKKENIPILESIRQTAPVVIPEKISIPEIITQPQPVKEQRETDDKAKAFVEKLKSRLGLSETVASESPAAALTPAPTAAPAHVTPEKEELETVKSDKGEAKDTSQAPVTVNIVLKDQSCLPFMTDVGMHILYYCKHCTHYSQQLLSVIEHIKQCEKKHTADSAACGGKEDEVAEYLETVALNEIKEERKHQMHEEERKKSAGGPSGEEEGDEILVEFDPEALTAQEPESDGKEEEEEMDQNNQDDDDEEWTPHPVKKITRVLMEETEEDRQQKLCDICDKPVFSFSLRRHMESHARREAEQAAKEKAKAIALGLDVVPESATENNQAEGVPIDTETHLSVETHVKGTVEVIGDTGAAAIAVPAQPEIQTTHQIEADVPQGVTIAIKETDAENIVELQENGPTVGSTAVRPESDFIVPKTIPKGLALKKTLFPCKIHELYFVSHEALTEHFTTEHWGGYVEPATVLPHIKRGRGRPRGSGNKGRGVGGGVKVSARPGITPDEEAAAVAMSVMRHSKLGWSRQRVNPGRSGPVKCPICYKKFSTAFRLDMHNARAHTTEKMKPIPCQECGKLFRNQVQRRNHYRIVHEGKKRIQSKSINRNREKKLFICDLCGYSTPDNSRLKNHIMSVHQGIMPYACDQCDYKCNEKSDIVRHKHKHLGIKRYQCEYCTYRADQRWLLVNHTAKQHGVQLPKIARNTRGSYFSMRNKKRRETLQQQINPLQWLLQQNPELQIQEPKGEHDEAMTEAAHAVLELGDVAGDGGEQVTVYIEEVMEDGGDTVEAYTEGQEISVEELQQVVHDSKPGEVMYVREDGTVLEPEEAALLLMSVNTPGSNIQIEEVQQVQQVQEEQPTTDGQEELQLVSIP